MKKILSYLPFVASLLLTITCILTFALTGTIGALALSIPFMLACWLTLESIQE